MMNNVKCGSCLSEGVRLYRPYGNFYRPEDNRCNACLPDGGVDWYVPLCLDTDGSVWGYTSVTPEAVSAFLSLPEKSDTAPRWIGVTGFADNAIKDGV